MRYIKIIAAMIAGISTVEANAATWLLSSTANTGARWYVDVDSVKSVDGLLDRNAIKAWVKIDYSKVATEKAREVRGLYFFRCSEEQAKTVARVSYHADGSVIDSYTPTYSNYEPVVPDTVLSGAMQMACAAMEYKKSQAS